VVVVVEIRGRVVGLVVDGVCDIITVTDDMVQSPPDMGSDPAHQLVEGLLTLEGRIVSVIHMTAILPFEPVAAPLAA
jgi:purine-binding chemotaxis protein CheW